MSDLRIKELAAELQDAISGLKQTEGLTETGVVTRVGDGVVWVYGLSKAGFSEVLEIEVDGDGPAARAFVLNLLEDELGAVLLDNETGVRAGAKVRLTGRSLEVPVGPEMVGRV